MNAYVDGAKIKNATITTIFSLLPIAVFIIKDCRKFMPSQLFRKTSPKTIYFLWKLDRNLMFLSHLGHQPTIFLAQVVNEIENCPVSINLLSRKQKAEPLNNVKIF